MGLFVYLGNLVRVWFLLTFFRNRTAKGTYISSLSWVGTWGPSPQITVRIASDDPIRRAESLIALVDWRDAVLTHSTTQAIQFQLLPPGDTSRGEISIDLDSADPRLVGGNIAVTDEFRTVLPGTYAGEMRGANISVSRSVPIKQVRAVVCHELGHALGMGGHSSDPRDTMFTGRIPSLPSARDVRTLEAAWKAAQ